MRIGRNAGTMVIAMVTVLNRSTEIIMGFGSDAASMTFATLILNGSTVIMNGFTNIVSSVIIMRIGRNNAVRAISTIVIRSR